MLEAIHNLITDRLDYYIKQSDVVIEKNETQVLVYMESALGISDIQPFIKFLSDTSSIDVYTRIKDGGIHYQIEVA